MLQVSLAQAFLAFFVCFIPLLLGFIIPAGFLFDWAIGAYSGVFNKDFYILLLNTLMLAFVTALLALGIALFLGYTNRNSYSFINKILVIKVIQHKTPNV